MKRRELIRKITAMGCKFVRPGKKHDVYKNPKTGRQQPVPRHNEVDEHLARHILKELA